MNAQQQQAPVIPSGSAAKVEDTKPLWYADSQRWDVDWWRMRLCGGSEWQNKSSSMTPGPKSLDAFLPSPPLYRQPHETLAWRMGRVWDRGMLSGLWQGYMHMPNESSLMYVRHTRQYPSNFGEQALGVMMRPVLVRFEEHAWVPRPGDPGRFKDTRVQEGNRRKKGRGKGRGTGRYWEKGMVEEEDEEEGYEYAEPSGEGSVPVAKPTTMIKIETPRPGSPGHPAQNPHSPTETKVGFLDENMNNAWFPGPVGSLRWEDGSIVATPEGNTRQASAEEGVWDGVWRDRYVSQEGEEGKRLKMKSVTFRIPSTFERGEGVEVLQTPPPAHAVPLAGGPAPLVQAGVLPAGAPAIGTNECVANGFPLVPLSDEVEADVEGRIPPTRGSPKPAWKEDDDAKIAVFGGAGGYRTATYV
ncbi:hypothetical protein NMY22_g20239 [Coprinellus aureogranulatus]|nr:hypothetical protein NMY22_g20239 [Coprinellus aureogranulatus]